MKERIYTIPINEAFDQDTECPLCVCERKLENDAVEYHIGPAMMEPDSRVETNKTGFCGPHYTKMYNLEQNRLPLALVIDTHLVGQIKDLEGIYKKYEGQILKESEKGLLDSVIDSVKGKKSPVEKATDEILRKLENLKSTCAVCDRIRMNMDRLIDNTLYLYDKEPDFRKKFYASKGFCLKHTEVLLRKAQKAFSVARQAEFLKGLLPLELVALKRVQGDVNHFTQMFDYRNAKADWKNSRDAVPRSIEKLSGPCELKR